MRTKADSSAFDPPAHPPVRLGYDDNYSSNKVITTLVIRPLDDPT